MHKIKLILLLILPLSVLGQDLGIIDTKTTKNPAINGTHRISTDGKNLFFRNFFGLSKKVASTDSAVFTGTTVLPSNTTIGNVSATELGYLDGVTSPIQAQLDGKFGLSLNNTATGNNVFTGNNTFFTPIFANTTSTNAFSKITGIWSGGVNNNIASFSLQYETKFGGNSIIRNPLNFDYNGWVGIGVTSPTVALDVSGSIKSTSTISALSLNSSSTTLLATNVGGNVGIGLGSPTSKLHVAGTGRITGALILDNTVSGLLRADASGNITSDATAYLSSSTAASTYAPITSPTFITDATTPRLKITGAGDVGKGSDLVMGGNSNDLTMHGTGKVILGTGGFQRLVVTNAGNVGVGTTAPVAKFEVSGLAGFRYNDGKQADGKYLRSNSTGVAAWDSVKVSEVFGLNTTYLPINNPTATGTLTAPTIANSLGATFATSSGNVGIGTSIPSQKLSVLVPDGTSIPTSGSAGGHQILSNGTYGMMLGVNNSGNGWIQAARTDATATNYNLLLNPNGGNVGIGTTSPRNTIEIDGVTANPTALNTNTANGTLLLSDGGNLGVVHGISNYNSSYQGYVQARNNAGVNSLAYDYLINPLGGNVGIGTSSPTMKLDVSGGARFGTTYVSPSYTNTINTGYGADVDGQELYFNYVGYNDGFTRFRNTSIANGKSSSILYAVGSTGRVGIGTTTPLRSLDVTDVIRSTSNFAGFEAIHNTGTSYRWTLNNDNNYYLQSSSDKFVANAAARFSLFDGGNIGIGTSTNLGYKLDVNGTARVAGDLSMTGTYPILTLFGSQSGSLNIRLQNYITGVSNTGFEIYDQTNTASRLAITGTGNVGIGTSSPTEKLEISGAGVVSSKITSTNSTAQLITSGTVGQIYNTTGDLYLTNASTTNSTLFVNNGAERMRIFSNGRVGINTTTDAGYLLDVNGSARFSNSASTGGIEIGQTGSTAKIQYNSNGNLDITPRSGYNTIFTAGNVGIGTTAPVAKLTVVGSDNAISMDAGASGNPYLDFHQNGVQKGYLQYVNTGAYIRLVDAGVVGLVQKDGKIGIGTTAPAAKLNIEGTGYTSALIRTSTTTAGGLLTLSNTTRSYSLGARGDYSAGQFNIVDETAGLARFSISSNGNVGIGTTTDSGWKLDVNGTTRFQNSTEHYGSATFRNASAITFYAPTGLRNVTQRRQVTGEGDENGIAHFGYNGTTFTIGIVEKDNGSVGIGTHSPAASSILDITSTTKGVLLPRMTTLQIEAIASPADGLTVYNTTLKVLCFYDGTGWKRVVHLAM